MGSKTTIIPDFSHIILFPIAANDDVCAQHSCPIVDPYDSLSGVECLKRPIPHINSLTPPLITLESSDDDDDDDGNVQLTTAPGDPMLLTPTGPMNNSIELQKLTTSVETMRASILQAWVGFSFLYWNCLRLFQLRRLTWTVHQNDRTTNVCFDCSLAKGTVGVNKRDQWTWWIFSVRLRISPINVKQKHFSGKINYSINAYAS